MPAKTWAGLANKFELQAMLTKLANSFPKKIQQGL